MATHSKILIADDHFPVRIGIEILIREILGQNINIDFAKDCPEVIERIRLKKYDILISDANMPGSDGLSMISRVLNILPDIKILIVSVNPEEVFAPLFIKAGAYGYINKGATDDELKKAMKSVLLGRKYYSEKQILLKRSEALGVITDNPFVKLSAREFQVAILIIKGNGSIEIANLLSIDPSTASTYRSRIFEKLKIKNNMELSVLARKFHIITDDMLLY